MKKNHSKQYLKKIIFFLIFSFLSTKIAIASDWNGSWYKDKLFQARVIPYSNQINKDLYIIAGLEIKMLKNWKTYWKDPGDAGLPAELTISNENNVKKIDILWPKPDLFLNQGIKTIGYKENIILPLKIYTKNNTDSINFNADLKFLICNKICVPKNAQISFHLNKDHKNIKIYKEKIDTFLNKVPKKIKSSSNQAKIIASNYKQNKNNYLDVLISSKETLLKNDELFLSLNGKSSFKKIKKEYLDNKSIIYTFETSSKNILDNELNINFFSKNINFETNTKIINGKLNSSKEGILFILLIAFIGGLILNLMPCALPILAIKTSSILNSKNNKNIKNTMLFIALGMIFTFLIGALIILGMQNLGIFIGWGSQFQNPIFLIILLFLMLIFIANTYEKWEFTLPQFISRAAINNNNSDLSNKLNSFFNGVFVTLLATPCSAPFIGVAIGYAFLQKGLNGFLIFTSIGIGMALPYLLFWLFPSFTRFIPKPGAWTAKIKYILGFFLSLTALYLLYILWLISNQVTSLLVLILLILSFAIILIIHNKKIYKYKFLSWIAILLIALFSSNYFEKDAKKKYLEQGWIAYNKSILEKNLNNNKIVFVDATARWCLTCRLNKITTINNKVVKNKFKKENVILLQADWTKPNKEVEILLQENNRGGIPLNIVYGPKNKKGIILSEILTPAELISAINKVK